MAQLTGVHARLVVEKYVDRIEQFYKLVERNIPTQEDVNELIPRMCQDEVWCRLPSKYREQVILVHSIRRDALIQDLVWTRVMPTGRCYFEYQFVTTAHDVADRHDLLVAEGAPSLAYAYPLMMSDRRFVLVPYNAAERTKDVESGILSREDISDIYGGRAILLQRRGTCSLTLNVSVAIRDGRVHTYSSEIGAVIGGYLDQRESP